MPFVGNSQTHELFGTKQDIPGNVPPSHNCTTDRDTHPSFRGCRAAWGEGPFTTLLFLNPAFLCSWEGEKGRAWQPSSLSRAAGSCPCPWLWCTLSSPSLTQLTVPTWHARNTQNKDRDNSDLLTNTSLPNTKPKPSHISLFTLIIHHPFQFKLLIFFKGERNVFFLTRNFQGIKNLFCYLFPHLWYRSKSSLNLSLSLDSSHTFLHLKILILIRSRPLSMPDSWGRIFFS